MKIRWVGSQGPYLLAIQIGDRYFTRTPYDEPDTPLRVDGLSDELVLAALFSKWGFLPVVDQDGNLYPEIEEDLFPIVAPGKAPDGSGAWQVQEIVPRYNEE